MSAPFTGFIPREAVWNTFITLIVENEHREKRFIEESQLHEAMNNRAEAYMLREKARAHREMARIAKIYWEDTDRQAVPAKGGRA